MALRNEHTPSRAAIPYSLEPRPVLHQNGQPQDAFPGSNYHPWIEPYSFFPAYPGSSLLPFSSPPVKKITSIKDIKSLDDIKLLISQLGGIEGIVSYLTKMQKLLQGLQQMSPMFKLLAKSFIKGRGAGVRSKPQGSDFKKRRIKRKRRHPVKRRKTGKKR